jgi:hypothetical protein
MVPVRTAMEMKPAIPSAIDDAWKIVQEWHPKDPKNMCTPPPLHVSCNRSKPEQFIVKARDYQDHHPENYFYRKEKTSEILIGNMSGIVIIKKKMIMMIIIEGTNQLLVYLPRVSL